MDNVLFGCTLKKIKIKFNDTYESTSTEEKIKEILFLIYTGKFIIQKWI